MRTAAVWTDARTVTLVYIMENRGDVSVPELFRFPNQSLFDGLVAGQHHHFLGSKVYGEHRPIFLGQLEWQRTQIEFLFHTRIIFPGRGWTHLAECLLRSAEVELQQVAKQRQRPGTWRLPPRSAAGAVSPGEDVQEQQEGDAGQHSGRTEGEEQLFLQRHLLLRRRALRREHRRSEGHTSLTPPNHHAPTPRNLSWDTGSSENTIACANLLDQSCFHQLL